METAITKRALNILRTAGLDHQIGIPQLPSALGTQRGNKTSPKPMPLNINLSLCSARALVRMHTHTFYTVGNLFSALVAVLHS